MTRIQKLEALKEQMDKAEFFDSEGRHMEADALLIATIRALATLGYATITEAIIEKFESFTKWYA